MHIHANSSLFLATFAVGREELHEIAARRAAEVRRKLSASRSLLHSQEPSASILRVERRSYGAQQRSNDDESFGRLFSATV